MAFTMERSKLRYSSASMLNMFKTKSVKTVGNTPVCKLPVMFFWIRKTISLALDKNTGRL